MYAQIHAKSDVNDDSPGKTMWVNEDNVQIEFSSSAPKHLDSPPWHIELKAQSYEESTGERGGEWKAITRTLEVHLTPADISKLLDVVLKNGLLSVSVVAGNTPRKA